MRIAVTFLHCTACPDFSVGLIPTTVELVVGLAVKQRTLSLHIHYGDKLGNGLQVWAIYQPKPR